MVKELSWTGFITRFLSKPTHCVEISWNAQNHWTNRFSSTIQPSQFERKTTISQLQINRVFFKVLKTIDDEDSCYRTHQSCSAHGDESRWVCNLFSSEWWNSSLLACVWSQRVSFHSPHWRLYIPNDWVTHKIFYFSSFHLKSQNKRVTTRKNITPIKQVAIR